MTRNEGCDEYVTREEAAKLLGVNVRTVDRYAKEGRLLKYIRLTRIVYLRQQVEELAIPVPCDAPVQLSRKRRKSRTTGQYGAALALLVLPPLAEALYQLIRAVSAMS